MPDIPLILVIVGINGAGKTSFYFNEIQPRFKGRFINADIWERDNFPSEVGKHSAEAARWAAEQRKWAIKNGESFVTEAVFFSVRNDVVRRAKEAGYRVELFQIHIESPLLARDRVEFRVGSGGHNVSKELIDQRFPHIETYVNGAMPFADRLQIYENSEFAQRHRHLLTIEKGAITDLGPNLPRAIERQHASKLVAYRMR